MNTIHARLMLSHLLPLLIVLPLIAGILVYVIESQVLMTQAAQSLVSQANLVAELVQAQSRVWQDSRFAQTFARNLGKTLAADVIVLDLEGEVVGSSRDLGQVSEQPLIDESELARIASGITITHIEYSFFIQDSDLEVLTPLRDVSGELIGALQLSGQLEVLAQQFERVRLLIFGILGLGLLVAVIVGTILSSVFNRRLNNIIRAIQEVAHGSKIDIGKAQGPREFEDVLVAVQTLSKDLSDAKDARERLLANLVHELGRPMGALQAAIHALMGGAYQDPTLRHDLLTGMDAQIERLKPLLDNLVQLSTQSSGQLTINETPVFLSTWLPQILAPWKTAAAAKDLNWHVTLPGDLPVVDIDPDRIAQVIGNLLSNAIKYTPEGGDVAVSVKSKSETLLIEVSDTGIGMTRQELSQAFEPFYRGSHPYRFPQGMGLGLSIAQEITRLHGGEIMVTSEVGQGSHFSIILPRNLSTLSPGSE